MTVLGRFHDTIQNRNDDFSLRRLCEALQKAEAIHKDNPLIENAESFTKSLESHKDSSDFIEFSNKMDCHDSAFAESRNDKKDDSAESTKIDCHAKPTACLAMTVLW